MNTTSSFTDFRKEQEFADVTLTFEGTKTIEAHKVVLVSGSYLFKTLITENKHLHGNPRNHPKLLSHKSWHLRIRNGPIARAFWNLNQSIDQKFKNLQLEKCRYIKDKNYVLGHCTVFSLKQLEKIVSLKFVQVGPALSCQLH